MTVLDLSPVIFLSDEEYYKLCQANPDVKLERDHQGRLIVMSPTGGETGNRNIEISYQLQAWSRQSNLGKAFDSSTEFKLPIGSNRSPDASWVRLDLWDSLTPDQRKQFPPLCPDFVIELRSESDRLKDLQAKMQEYLDSGLRLGWLIDPQNKLVEIYRQEREVEVLQSPLAVSGEDVLPGFILDLTQIWQ